MTVNRATQKNFVRLVGPHARRDNLVGAVLWSKGRPLPSTGTTRRLTGENPGRSHIVAHADEIGGHSAPVVLRPEHSSVTN